MYLIQVGRWCIYTLGYCGSVSVSKMNPGHQRAGGSGPCKIWMASEGVPSTVINYLTYTKYSVVWCMYTYIHTRRQTNYRSQADTVAYISTEHLVLDQQRVHE